MRFLTFFGKNILQDLQKCYIIDLFKGNGNAKSYQQPSLRFPQNGSQIIIKREVKTMNEIQAVKTAKIEEVKKNSKKGFTLVELVVVIAILAILAAIAIPVVSSTITSSQRSSAKSNAQTIEVAIKEADAAISAKDDTVFIDKTKTPPDFKASNGTLTLANISTAKAIDSAVAATYQIDGVNYSAYYDNNTQKVVFIGYSTKTSKVVDVDGNVYSTGATVGTVPLSTAGTNGQEVAKTVSFNGTGTAKGTASSPAAPKS